MLAIVKPITKQLVTPTVMYVWVNGSSTTVKLDKQRNIVVPPGCKFTEIGNNEFRVSSSLPEVKVQVDQAYINIYFTLSREWSCRYMHNGPL
jgi:hypothetical protein